MKKMLAIGLMGSIIMLRLSAAAELKPTAVNKVVEKIKNSLYRPHTGWDPTVDYDQFLGYLSELDSLLGLVWTGPRSIWAKASGGTAWQRALVLESLLPFTEKAASMMGKFNPDWVVAYIAPLHERLLKIWNKIAPNSEPYNSLIRKLRERDPEDMMQQIANVIQSASAK